MIMFQRAAMKISTRCPASPLNNQRRYFVAMHSTALTLAGLVLSGCTPTVTKEPPAPEQQRPIIIDDAMRHREWSTSVAVIPTGATVGGPTLFAFQPVEKMNWPLDGSYFEIPVFLGNIAVLPLAAFIDPPWTPTVYRGANIRPSYTMSPAYPEDLPPAQPLVKPKKAGDEADAPWARHYRKNASTRPVF